MADKEYLSMIEPANYKKMFKKDFTFKQGLLFSLIFHVCLITLFAFTSLESRPVEEKQVTLKLEKSHAPRKIVKARRQEQQRARQAAQKNNTPRNDTKSDQQNTVPADKNPFKDMDNNPIADNAKGDDNKPLFKDDTFPGGDNDNKISGGAGQDQTNRPTGNGLVLSRGTDSSQGTPGGTTGLPDGPGNSTGTATSISDPFAGGNTGGNTGTTMKPSTGVASLSGRQTVGRPYISIPDRYKKQGLSYFVTVNIRVNAEGIVIGADVATPGIQPALATLLTRYARRYRFQQAASGTPVQNGAVKFTIRPRR